MRIVSVGGAAVHDQLDFAFLAVGRVLPLELESESGNRLAVTLREDDMAAIELEPMKPKGCGCRCLFCFIDQLPRGLRHSLYHKDEDYRFSYLYGNYVTLANVTDCDIDRIIRYRLSPIYISVHATDPVVRSRLLGVSRLRPILPVLRRFAAGRIIMHCQVVLCPGINDGSVLEATIDDLGALFPHVASLAVVPVGLTGHRRSLPQLQPVDAKTARRVLACLAAKQAEFSARLGEPFVYAADEFYLRARRPVPPANFYGDFPQQENGVGLLRLFLDDAEKLLRRKNLRPIDASVCIVTGEIAVGTIKPYIDALALRTGGCFDVISIPNRLFGGGVTVTGLVGGADIARVLRRRRHDIVCVPDVMLRDGRNKFLDDFSITDLSAAVKADVCVVRPFLSDLYRKLSRLKTS